LNITDNQAVTALKDYLAKEQCAWQSVGPNNHRVNAAERAIQTFKNHFISGLCTTNKNFPLQLWDQLATQEAQDTLNLLRTSRHDPSKSAYAALNGAYDFNKWPMAPPGTKAIIWESPTSRQSWAPRGIDAWYVGPAKDHYRLYRFYCPDTQAYRINGSVKFFPQHCKLPQLNDNQHADTVANELFECIPNLKKANRNTIIRNIANRLKAMTTNTDAPIQRVLDDNTPTAPEQRVELNDPITTSTNPTAPQVVATTPRVHQRRTRHNHPGQTAKIVSPIINEPRRSHRLQPTPIIPTATSFPVNGFQSPNIITQEAAYYLAAPSNVRVWTPHHFITSSPNTYRNNLDIDFFANPVIHPVTGATITRYQTLAKDPITRDTWTTAFGKEFGNLAQGDQQTNTKGTDCIFVCPTTRLPSFQTTVPYRNLCQQRCR
jgi:hypothetical protein